MKPAHLPLLLSSPRRRKRFVLLPENRSAVHAVRWVARLISSSRQSERVFPPLYIHGAPGSGKSHLVKQLLKRVIARRPNFTVRQIAARELVRLLTEMGSHGTKPGGEFRDCDLLIVEDLQHLPSSGVAAFAGLIDHRQARQAPVVFTAASGPAMLIHLPQRLTSRLSAGLVIGIAPFSAASRRKLARKLCDQHGLQVTDEVIGWLAAAPSGGARPIIGNIHRLERLATRAAPPLGLATVLAELPEIAKAPPLERLLERVAGHFGLTRKQIKGRDRHRNLLWPRQVGMFLARKITDLSLPRIGAYFGGYDHSTVLHSCRKVEQRLRDDIALAKTLEQLAALCA